MTTLITTASAVAILYGLYWLFIGEGSWKYDFKLLPFLRFCIRLFFRHVILAFKLVFGFILGIVFCLLALEGAAAYSGAQVSVDTGGLQSEKFFKFANILTSPLQYMLEGFMTILGCIALLLIFFVEGFSKWVKTNPTPAIAIAATAYSIWLYFNVKRIWVDEFGDGSRCSLSPYAAPGVVPTSLEEGGYFFPRH